MLRLLITTIALERKSVEEPVEKNVELESTYISPPMLRTPKSTDRRCSLPYLKKSAA